MYVVGKGPHERLRPVTMSGENIVTDCCVDTTNDVDGACLVLFLSFLHYDVRVVVVEVVFDNLGPGPRLNPVLVRVKAVNLGDY